MNTTLFSLIFKEDGDSLCLGRFYLSVACTSNSLYGRHYDVALSVWRDCRLQYFLKRKIRRVCFAACKARNDI